ncbi:MAG: hypothetical protein LC723_07170 [Actinobacteria bacterium]|nr:hypothetical protein [Actinomycetota bacterium]
MEDWLASVRAFVDEVGAGFTVEERRDVDSLLDHGEPAEGLVMLAWALEKRDGQVDPEVARRLADLAGELVAKEHYPPSVKRAIERDE